MKNKFSLALMSAALLSVPALAQRPDRQVGNYVIQDRADGCVLGIRMEPGYRFGLAHLVAGGPFYFTVHSTELSRLKEIAGREDVRLIIDLHGRKRTILAKINRHPSGSWGVVGYPLDQRFVDDLEDSIVIRLVLEIGGQRAEIGRFSLGDIQTPMQVYRQCEAER